MYVPHYILDFSNQSAIGNHKSSIQYVPHYIAKSMFKSFWNQRPPLHFIIKEGIQITEAIQVCFSLENEKTKQRELQALKEVKDELKAERLTVITDDQESTVSIELPGGQDEINIIPLWKWLLRPPLTTDK